jgi:large subunit ribosomal protein L32e
MNKVRQQIKAKRPTFTRHEAGQKKRVAPNWRKPKGHQNKMRLGVKGAKVTVSQGYRMPKSVRGLDTRTSLIPVVVVREKDLESIDAKTQGIIVGATVGTKKRLAIFEVAEKKGITIINIRDVNAYKENFEKKKAATKTQKNKKKATKDKVKKADEKKASDKKKEEEEAKAALKGDESQESGTKEKKKQEKILHHKQ